MGTYRGSGVREGGLRQLSVHCFPGLSSCGLATGTVLEGAGGTLEEEGPWFPVLFLYLEARGTHPRGSVSADPKDGFAGRAHTGRFPGSSAVQHCRRQAPVNPAGAALQWTCLPSGRIRHVFSGEVWIPRFSDLLLPWVLCSLYLLLLYSLVAHRSQPLIVYNKFSLIDYRVVSVSRLHRDTEILKCCMGHYI